MNKLTNSINQLFNNSVKPKLAIFDAKITTFIPSPKVKKIAYIGVGSLFGFMFLIILLGLLLSPFRNSSQNQISTIKKPNIVNYSPEPLKELTESQKEILNIEKETKELVFPQSILNIPQVERDITI